MTEEQLNHHEEAVSRTVSREKRLWQESKQDAGIAARVRRIDAEKNVEALKQERRAGKDLIHRRSDFYRNKPDRK